MIDLIVRTSLILAAAGLACRLLPRATAATRHLVWHAAIVGVLLAPIVLFVLPTFEIPVLPAPSTVGRMTAAFAPAPAPPAPVSTSTVAPSHRRTIALAAVWASGSTFVAFWFVIAHAAAAARFRRSHPAPPVLQNAAEALSKRRVCVRVATGEEGPLVSGVFRPWILLPGSATCWDAGRARTVLRHELAHVRRGDCRAQLLAQVACAAYWFNPLIWVAAHALRTEREHACDDEVMAQGAAPSAYAAELLDLARARQRPLAAGSIEMARPSQLEGRVVAILATGRARVPAGATRWVVAAAVLAMSVVTLGATAALQPRHSDSVPARGTASVPDQSADAREKATLALALDSSDEAIPALLDALRDPDSQVREKAALGLGWRRDDRVIEPLIAALRDEDSQVREKAAIALGSSGDPRAVAPLEAALADPDGQVREKAAAGLMLLRIGGDPHNDGKRVRAALSGMVNGLLQLTK